MSEDRDEIGHLLVEEMDDLDLEDDDDDEYPDMSPAEAMTRLKALRDSQ
jgi:hypothetical protein